MKEYYTNKVAVITGGASGIGLALVEMLLSLDGKAIIIVDINSDKLKQETKRLENLYPGKVLGLKVDVTKEEEVVEMIRRAAEFGHGRIDFLFNNAGLGLAKAFKETSEADWKFAFEVNFYSAVHATRAVLPIMRAQGGGHIANTASGIGFVHFPYQSMYSATKAALIALTGSLRYEFWDENIRFSAIIPGTVATPIWGDHAPDSAITPQESAQGILEGVAQNKKVVFVTDQDRDGALGAIYSDTAQEMDEYLVDIARKRKNGAIGAI
jgi:NAD(P)-dependent dehydrogenase (short-subunit alcohol dehydrogenase family)